MLLGFIPFREGDWDESSSSTDFEPLIRFVIVRIGNVGRGSCGTG